MRATRGIIWWGLLLAASIFQAFVRSDVVFVLGISLVLMSFAGTVLGQFGSRWSNVLKGLCVALIACSIQAYLQFIRFPHLTYWPGTDVIQFRNNFTLYNLSSAVLALLPFLIVVTWMIKSRIPIKGCDALVIASSILYFCLWSTVGILDEVRIFVPFLMALCVVAAKASAFLMTRDLR